MFKKIKEFFTSSKPTVEVTNQEVTLTAADVAIKNIKETTASLDAKVEVAPAIVETPEPVKEQAWTTKPAPPVTKTAKPKKQQSTKATTTAPKKRKPAPK